MSIAVPAVDLWIIAAYMLAVLLLGIWLGRGRRSSADYFLGNRSLPWGALLISIVATETSTVTFLSIPGIAAAAGGNLTFLQITVGYIVGRLFVVFFLLPLYFEGRPFTAYELLEGRFGRLTRRCISALFLLTRNSSDALRLFLTALVLQVVLGLDLAASAIAIGAVTVVYTFAGGARSVIWNDCLQFVIYVGGAALAAFILVDAVPGGLAGLADFAASNGKLEVLDFDTDLFKPTMTFWAGLAGGAFLTAATHGTDQLMVQRYLAAKNQRGASLALGLSGFIVLAQFALFLLIGVGLAGLFDASGELQGVAVKSDQLFAHFMVNYLPAGLLGLSLAAVFAAAMSTLSSSLNASAAALMNDLVLPAVRGGLSEARQLRAGRIATVLFGVLQVGLAVIFGWVDVDESTVSGVLKVSGFAAGPVLGLYFIAAFFPAVRQPAALLGFAIGIAVLSIVAMATPLYWAWYAMLGSVATLLGGLLAAKFGRLEKGSETTQ